MENNTDNDMESEVIYVKLLTVGLHAGDSARSTATVPMRVCTGVGMFANQEPSSYAFQTCKGFLHCWEYSWRKDPSPFN